MEKRVPTYVLKLDNTNILKRLSNRIFLKLLRNRFNYESYSMQARGRHSSRDQAFVNNDHKPNSHRDVPVRFAETVAIYIRAK